MNQYLRSFIAVELPEEVHKYLDTIKIRLKKADIDAKWVNPEDIHLTLNFLGNVLEKNLEAIKKIIDRTTARHRAFDIEIGTLGTFSKQSRPRVVWAGLTKGREELTGLVDNLEVGLIDIGLKSEDKAFHPHLTLARIKSGRNKQTLKKTIEKFNISKNNKKNAAGPVIINIDRLTLFKSTLTPKGPSYTVLHESHLQS